MQIVFRDEFYNSDYADDSASVPGRMESIVDALKSDSSMKFIPTYEANITDIELVHPIDYITKVQLNSKTYQMALLAAGGAITAAEAAMKGETTFACIRPPGHHANRTMSWGYCHFNNMGVAINRLINNGRIKSAFILDFDAHTGDGTLDVFSENKSVKILNPYSDTAGKYLQSIEDYTSKLHDIDIIAVCAGFDSYEKDLGKKLSTFDFYKIGFMMKKLSKRMGHERRFAILEGGYYLPDLGKNVLAFCQGFQ